jgi:hypothetical protein
MRTVLKYKAAWTVAALAIATALFVGVLAGCQNPMDALKAQDTPDSAAGRVALVINPQTARTLLPTDPTFTKYGLSVQKKTEDGSANDGAAVTLDDITATTASLDLSPGKYVLTVKGYVNTAVAAQGVSALFTVTSNADTPVTVTLSPVTDAGTGTLKYTIDVDAGLTASLDIGGEPAINLTTGSTNTDSVSLAAGEYLVELTVSKSGSQTRTWAEVAHVYSNLETAFTRSIAANYLTLDPITGTPVITGSAVVGETLTVTTTGLTTNGSGTFSYVWKRDGTPITGATSATYQLVNADVDQTITVTVSHSENSGSVTSAATGTVEKSPGLYVGASATAETGVSSPFSLVNALAWIGSNAAANGSYTIVLGGDESSGPVYLSQNVINNASGITITLKGSGGQRTITLTSNGSLFSVADLNGADVTLILDKGITLAGKTANNLPLVRVNKSATLKMKNGAVIKDNVNASTSSTYGGGVRIQYGGTFIMDGGDIQNNKVGTTNYNGRGGGVYVDGAGSSVPAGQFTMNGGTISDNQAIGQSTGSSYGGGVYLAGSTSSGVTTKALFTLNDGTISGNTASNGSGGGIYAGAGSVRGSTFIMNGGTVSSNQATGSSSDMGRGGAVVLGYGSNGNYGEFTMTGGIITDTNTAARDGATLYITNTGGANLVKYGGAYGSNTILGSGVQYTSQALPTSGYASIAAND